MNGTSRRKLRWLPSPPGPGPEPEPPTPTGEDPQFKFSGWTIPVTIRLSQIGNSTSFNFEYLGEARIPTLSGKRPPNLDYTATASNIKLTRTDQGYTGEGNAICTLTLPATAQYREATATLTITYCDEAALIDI